MMYLVSSYAGDSLPQGRLHEIINVDEHDFQVVNIDGRVILFPKYLLDHGAFFVVEIDE